MEAEVDIPSLVAAKRYIDQMDLEMVIMKLAREPDWHEGDAKICSLLYRNYLYLMKKYNEYLPPSEEIDAFWHQHILDTEKYHRDCKMIFGKYLHHYPYFGIDEKSNQNDLDTAFNRTQELYFKEFGEYL